MSCVFPCTCKLIILYVYTLNYRVALAAAAVSLKRNPFETKRLWYHERGEEEEKEEEEGTGCDGDDFVEDFKTILA